MKVAFINPNYHNPQGRPPLGLLSVATVCKDAGHEVKIIDANLLNLDASTVASWIWSYDLVGITATTPSYPEAQSIAQYIKSFAPYKSIVLGGVHASVFPQECANSGLFDAVVVGEGENAMLHFINNFQVLKSQKLLPIVLRQDVDINNISIPEYTLLDIDAYKPRYPHGLNGRWMAASTSRGCPFDCSFCCKAISGNKFRAMNANGLCELFLQFQRLGIQDVTFYDDIFTLDKIRLKSSFEYLQFRGIKLSWTCESRVSITDQWLLTAMAEAGCRMIYYGIESGNQNILNKLSKAISLNQVRHAVKVTHDCGIKTAGYFMLGCPGETQETMQQTIDFAKELKLDHAQFSVCSPLPGSMLYKQYISLGYQVPDWSNFKYLGAGDKPMFTSKELPKEDIENAVREANEEWQVKI